MKTNVLSLRLLRHIKPFFFIISLFGWLTQPLLAEDDYLSLISSEAQKIDETSSSASPEEKKATLDEAQVQAFEATLKDQFKGSYFVYTRLDEQAKKSLQKDYASGATFEEIRTKILALYSNK